MKSQMTKLICMRELFHSSDWSEINLRSGIYHFLEDIRGAKIEETILPPKYQPPVKSYLVLSWEKQVLNAPRLSKFKGSEASIEQAKRMKILQATEYTEKSIGYGIEVTTQRAKIQRKLR